MTVCAVGRLALGHGQPRWSPNDGLIRVTPHTADALAAQRLTARAYSLSALQKFSACPYQFALSAIYRLQPLERPEPLQRMDPLTRGSIFHEVQARFFRDMDARGALPVTQATVTAAAEALDGAVDEVAAWRTISWRRRSSGSGSTRSPRSAAICTPGCSTWRPMGKSGLPKYFELAFGQVPGSATSTACATR
jgi:hypothetical protein